MPLESRDAPGLRAPHQSWIAATGQDRPAVVISSSATHCATLAGYDTGDMDRRGVSARPQGVPLGRPGVTRWGAWWRELSAPEKFRLYSRLSLQAGIVVAGASASVAISLHGRGPLPAAGMVVSALAGVVAVSAQPALAIRSGATFRRSTLPTAAATQTAVWLASAVVARRVTGEPAITGAGYVGIFAVVLATVSLVPFARRKWLIVLGVSVATGLAFGASPAGVFWLVVTILLVGSSVVGLMLLTLWGLRLFDDLERTKDIEASCISPRSGCASPATCTMSSAAASRRSR